VALQKEWKEIGAVPRKKSEQLWKRFRAACDEFFAERDKHASENNFYGNLKAKTRLIEEISSYELKGDESDAAAMKDFQARWNEIGFVPFKEKEKIAKAYKDAMSRFPNPSRQRRGTKPQLSDKERLIQKYHALEQDIATYENNIGFFSMSKNSEPLIRQMQQRIEQAKTELAAIADQIKKLKEKEEE
jgi:chaperonin cofactor prefoldin